MSQISRYLYNVSKNIRVQSMFPPITYKLRHDANLLKSATNIVPKLAVCHSDDDYILSDTWEMIDLTATMVDIEVFPIALPRNDLSQCRQILHELNEDKSIHGISLHDVNLSLEESSVFDLYPQISAIKDVDGRNPFNFAYLRTARELVSRTKRFRFDDMQYHVPLLAQGIVEMLDRLLVTIEGANIFVLGSSSRHSLEISLLFSKLHATVTVANDLTSPESMVRSISGSDIIILSDESAIRRMHPFLKYLRAESVVVDATIDQESTVEDKRYIYDFYKPVNMVQCPETMILLMLMRNTIRAAQRTES